MLIEVIIDTNNTNYDPIKYPYSEELWNILVPNIKYLETSEGLQPASDIDWKITKKQFSDSNGHCIEQVSGGYIAAYEYESLYFEEEFLKSIYNTVYPRNFLSYLLAEIAIKNNIQWSYVEEYKKEFDNVEYKTIDYTGMISLWNNQQYMVTPLVKLIEDNKNKDSKNE